MSFNRLSILGVGLLGGSIGLAVRSKLNDCTVIGYGHRRTTLEIALRLGAISEIAEAPELAVRDADLVILCTPVGLLGPTLAKIAPSLAPGSIVTDVGSTKHSVVAAAQSLPRHAHFVGSHPMAGSEKRGVEHARATLFQNATCILTPTAQTSLAALARLESFWQLLGMKTLRLAPDEHDRLLADVSHLPHALASALMSMQDNSALPLAGQGFLDTTRIAAGDGALWRDIFHDNRDNLRGSITRLKSTLDHLLALLDPSKANELANWLDTVAARRQAMKRKPENEE